MTNETLRMQMLAGVITESEYKAKLQESLWDRIKDTPKAWIAKIKGGASATMASALSDGGFKIGVPVYAYDGGELYKLTIKSINYNTGISDVIYEKSLDGGKNWKTDEKESLKTKLGIEQDLSSLLKKTPEEQKAWYDKTVESIKDNFSTKDMSYRIEDLKPNTPKEKPEWKSNKYIDTPSFSLERQRELGLQENKKKPLKEHFIGMGAINSPFIERKKETYEDAFEHFLGQKYDLKENEETNSLQSISNELKSHHLRENDKKDVEVIADLIKNNELQKAALLIQDLDTGIKELVLNDIQDIDEKLLDIMFDFPTDYLTTAKAKSNEEEIGENKKQDSYIMGEGEIEVNEDEFTMAMNIQAIINQLLNIEGGQEALNLLGKISEWNELVNMSTDM
jgi:hypothetical protein